MAATATLRPGRSTPIWRAGRDTVAHAHQRGDLRTACGQRIVDERLAWPAGSKCPDCLAAVGLSFEARA